MIDVIALLGPLDPTDARVWGHRNSIKLKLAADHLLDAIEDRPSPLRTNTWKHQTELIATESRRRVTRPEFLQHPLGHTVQENVAVGVAQCVVYFFEPIEVDNRYRHRQARSCVGVDRVFHAVRKERPVRHSRERVMQ
ncbi:unannotated protein [freshwater metagenome]|uniref:Unannotated protein n=1 Tax=freshwater metagenome TaxID=449393 RepID=A0A6J6P1H7_9ZZZZ